MRFHRTLDDILGNPVRVRVLRVLASSSGRGFTGRELARQVGSSASRTIAALEVLESSGLVLRDIAGRSHLWRLSEVHVLSPLVRSLFGEEASALDRLRSDLMSALKDLPVERAWVFGSVARGDERPTSDVDLLVEVRTRAEKRSVEDALSGLSARFALKFGNPLSTVVSEQRGFGPKGLRPLLSTATREGLEVKV